MIRMGKLQFSQGISWYLPARREKSFAANTKPLNLTYHHSMIMIDSIAGRNRYGDTKINAVCDSQDLLPMLLSIYQ